MSSCLHLCRLRHILPVTVISALLSASAVQDELDVLSGFNALLDLTSPSDPC